mmetsp:Transcript_10139/g.23447  ORF Transcript_10139/g.23447 Transcript_10139/m.23447 type:complete len:265 (-) Transcript_10139:239-1033(-)
MSSNCRALQHRMCDHLFNTAASVTWHMFLQHHLIRCPASGWQTDRPWLISSNGRSRAAMDQIRRRLRSRKSVLARLMERQVARGPREVEQHEDGVSIRGARPQRRVHAGGAVGQREGASRCTGPQRATRWQRLERGSDRACASPITRTAPWPRVTWRRRAIARAKRRRAIGPVAHHVVAGEQRRCRRLEARRRLGVVEVGLGARRTAPAHNDVDSSLQERLEASRILPRHHVAQARGEALDHAAAAAHVGVAPAVDHLIDCRHL